MSEIKRWMKLGLALVVVVALAAFGLAGCSSDETTTDGDVAAESETQEATDEQTVEEDAVEQVELQIFAANSLEKALDEVQALYTEQTVSHSPTRSMKPPAL